MIMHDAGHMHSYIASELVKNKFIQSVDSPGPQLHHFLYRHSQDVGTKRWNGEGKQKILMYI